MIGTAIAIKLDSKGPVLFRQSATASTMKSSTCLKFRSMYTEQCDPTARAAVTKGDPRVTGRPLHPQDLDRRVAAVLQRLAR
jgi:lipopolysaccharide/colanic/teichoic acid biosynthesis glycosyltransferase